MLLEWTDRLRRETGEGFPEKVTAFRDGMAVHGRYRAAVPRVRHTRAAHPLRRERDQLLPALPDRGPAAGRPRALAAAEQDWPRSLEEMEERLKS